MATTPSKDAPTNPTSPPKADPPKGAPVNPPEVKTTTIGAPPPEPQQAPPPPPPPQHAPPSQVNIHGQPPRPNMAPAPATPKTGIGANTRAEMEAGAANLAQYKDRDKAEHEAGRRNINPGQTDEQPE